MNVRLYVPGCSAGPSPGRWSRGGRGLVGAFSTGFLQSRGTPKVPKFGEIKKFLGETYYFLGFSKGLKPHFTIFELLTSQYTACKLKLCRSFFL